MEYRTPGCSGLKFSAISLGCWAISGPSWRDSGAVGWSGNNDGDSLTGLHHAHKDAWQVDFNARASAPALTADDVAFVKQRLQE